MKGADSTSVNSDGKRVKMALHALQLDSHFSSRSFVARECNPPAFTFAAYFPLHPGAAGVWYVVFQLQALGKARYD